MKKIALSLVLFAIMISGCASLQGLIPQSKKDRAVDQALKALCSNATEAKAFIKGSKLEGAIDFEALCAK